MFDTAQWGLSDEGLVPPPPTEWSTIQPDGFLPLELEQHYLAPGDFEQVERIGAWERMIAWAQSMQLAEMASFVSRGESDAPPAMRDVASESAVAESGLMLRVATGTAHLRVHDAQTLIERYPATFAALRAGRITLPKARIIAEQTAMLSAVEAAAIETRVLRKAPDQTPGELRAAIRRAVTQADPDAVRRRHDTKKSERSVQMWDEPDGMAVLFAHLTAAEATGVYAVLDECARAAGGPADERPMDARRADALVDLILAPTGLTSAGTAEAQADWSPAERERARSRRDRVRVQVRVTVPFSTLFGIDETPGELAGYGPIPPDAARELATQGTWRRILTDPMSGALLDYGTTVYRPPAHLAEHVITRDQTCGFPGCRQPAHRCDLDHRVPFDPVNDTGPTADYNIGPGCRPHHQVKQSPGWSVIQQPDGTVTWTTPSGHTYTTTPPPVGDPVPAPEPEPVPDPDEPPPF